MFKKILQAFPPPKFLEVPFAGISIYDSAVRCIQFGKKDNEVYIEKYAEKALLPGVVSGGQINRKEELVTILKNLKQDLKLGFVKISLPEEKGYLFTAKIPTIKQAEVKSAIESKIEENVPVSPSELIFDYKLVTSHHPGRLEVVVSTLPINVIETYVGIAEAAGLQLLALEIESQAIIRSLLAKEMTDTVLVVNFGPEKVGLYVASERVVQFTSTVATKGESSNSPDFLLQEIKKLYTYWHTLKENVDRPEKKIKQIILCGENIGEDMIPYLSAHNPTPIALGNVWTNAFDINKIVPEIKFLDSLRYAAAVGLALPGKFLI